LFTTVISDIIFIIKELILMYFNKVAEYKTLIYGDELIEKKAIAGAVAGLFRAFAPKIAPLGQKVITKGVQAVNKGIEGYNAFAKAGVGRKAVMGAKAGAGIGAVKGGLNYDSTTDDGSFGSSRLGQVAKGALGGAAIGAAAGGTIGVAAKGLKPIKPMSTPPSPATGAQTVGGATGAAKAPTGASTAQVSQPKPKPAGAKVNPKVNPTTGHAELDPSQYRVADYIDYLYMEKISSERGV
jgi:hypothetical protein